jgi:hypothetical protein
LWNEIKKSRLQEGRVKKRMIGNSFPLSQERKEEGHRGFPIQI